MVRAEGSTVVIEQGMDPLKEEYVVMQIYAGEELVHRAGHIACGGEFPVFGELETSALFTVQFWPKGLLLNAAASYPHEYSPHYCV